MWLSDKQAEQVIRLVRIAELAAENSKMPGQTLKQRAPLAHNLAEMETLVKQIKLPTEIRPAEDVQNLRTILGELDAAIDSLLDDSEAQINYHTAPTWASQNLEEQHQKLKGILARYELHPHR